nr:retrovirus-related Pol polyprotein from transposon TNT 1-94 [Tanacetum cinerariifolium]
MVGLSFRMFKVDRIEDRGTMHGVQVQLVMGELRTKLEYFKDKMLLMQAQENRVALEEEKLLFIAGGKDNAINKNVDEQPIQDLALNDAVCEHHEVHEIHDDVQPNYVVDSHTDDTSDSNMIPYDQYVMDNAVPVVQSNVSAAPNDAY